MAKSKSKATPRHLPLTLEQKAEHFDRIMATWAQAEQGSRNREQEKGEREAKKTYGVHLSPEALDAALRALSDINLGAAACVELAKDSTNAPNSEWYAVAIENIGKVCARKADFLTALLADGEPGFGNFEDEFSAEAWKRKTTSNAERTAEAGQ